MYIIFVLQSKVLRKILSYEEILANRFYLILREILDD